MQWVEEKKKLPQGMGNRISRQRHAYLEQERCGLWLYRDIFLDSSLTLHWEIFISSPVNAIEWSAL